MPRHLYKHTIVARLDFEREYDPTKPETFTQCLDQIADIRKGLEETGAVLEKDSGKPVTTRD